VAGTEAELFEDASGLRLGGECGKVGCSGDEDVKEPEQIRSYYAFPFGGHLLAIYSMPLLWEYVATREVLSTHYITPI
jgi:hypothetical protein